MTAHRRYWLLKSEPSAFSWNDLWTAPKRTTSWDGVRNFQARNFMRDDMRTSDLAFFYHSSADPTAIMGVCEIVRAGYPDDTAFDSHSHHFDPKSDLKKPTWYMVDIRAVKPFPHPLTLERLRAERGLAQMVLLKRGSRLSVQPVTEPEWEIVNRIATSD
jgi:predicted RNA-binding protein with PUA-like domain